MKNTIVMIGCALPVAAFAMADRTPPVYGRPTLYGEYEISSGDTRRAAVLYGAVPKNAAEKMPVKAKKVMPKKSVKKKKTQKKSSSTKPMEPMPIVIAPAAPDDVIVVPARAAAPIAEPHEQKKAPIPSPDAVAIAGAVTDDTPGLESFCTRRGKLRKGARPDGVILMPGRPDLMSCTGK